MFLLQDNNQTALHLAVELDDDRTLYLVDFMVQNSNRCARVHPCGCREFSLCRWRSAACGVTYGLV